MPPSVCLQVMGGGRNIGASGALGLIIFLFDNLDIKIK